MGNVNTDLFTFHQESRRRKKKKTPTGDRGVSDCRKEVSKDYGEERRKIDVYYGKETMLCYLRVRFKVKTS